MCGMQLEATVQPLQLDDLPCPPVQRPAWRITPPGVDACGRTCVEGCLRDKACGTGPCCMAGVQRG